MNGPTDPKDLLPPPPHEIFRRAMERKDASKDYEIPDMTDELYELRREVIDIIYDAKDLCDLPWIKVKIVEYQNSTLGTAWMEGNKMYIATRAVEKDSIDLRGLVYHEILHTVFGVDHVGGCPLMDPTHPEREYSKEELDELFVKYATEFGGECEGGLDASKTARYRVDEEEVRSILAASKYIQVLRVKDLHDFPTIGFQIHFEDFPSVGMGSTVTYDWMEGTYTTAVRFPQIKRGRAKEVRNKINSSLEDTAYDFRLEGVGGQTRPHLHGYKTVKPNRFTDELEHLTKIIHQIYKVYKRGR